MNNNTKIGVNILCETAKEQYLLDRERHVCSDWDGDYCHSFVTNSEVLRIVDYYCINFAFLDIKSSCYFNNDGTVVNTILVEIITAIGGKVTNKKQLKKELTEYIQNKFTKLFNK